MNRINLHKGDKKQETASEQTTDTHPQNDAQKNQTEKSLNSKLLLIFIAFPIVLVASFAYAIPGSICIAFLAYKLFQTDKKLQSLKSSISLVNYKVTNALSIVTIIFGILHVAFNPVSGIFITCVGVALMLFRQKNMATPHKKRTTISLVIVALFCIFGVAIHPDFDDVDSAPAASAASSSAAAASSTAEPEPSLSPEEIKEAAGSADLQIHGLLEASTRYYTNLATKISVDQASDFETYDYCEELISYTSKFYKEVNDIGDDSAENYKNAVREAIGNITLIAVDLQKYIDKGSMSSLESVKQGIQLMPEYVARVDEARTAYLKQAGFTDDEIAARINKD